MPSRAAPIRAVVSIVIVTSVLGPAAVTGSVAADPSIGIEYDGDRVTVANGTTQVVSGTADAPVGTEILVRVRSSGDTHPAFLKAKSGVVTANGTWAVAIDFDDQTAGDTFELTARIENGSAEAAVEGDVVACKGECADTPPSGTPTPIPEQTATATPTAEPETAVTFGESIFVAEGGGVAAIPIAFEGGSTDEAVVVIGNETDANYELEVVVTDGDGDGEAVVYLDTAIAGREGDPLSVSGGDSVTIRSETALSAPLAPASYDVSLYGGERSSSPADIGTLVVQSTPTRTAATNTASTPIGGTDGSGGAGLDSLAVGGVVSGAFLVGGALLAAILLRQ